jgi:uncharacterized membrane protein YfcA
MPTLDPRLVVAALAVVLAGIAKGVTGMGLPVIGVPILVALYGDLRAVLPVTILATILSDVAMGLRWRRDVRELAIFVPFGLAGLVGIVLGSRLLLVIRPQILSLALAAVLVAFIAATWLGKMPTIARAKALRYGAGVGVIAGVLQGATGASGPIVTSYLLSTKISRATFLLAINVVFLILDTTQAVSLAQFGLLRANILGVALAVCGLTGVGLAFGLAIQHRINDALFRHAILGLLSLATLGLILRAL